jgi:hypothetical protein
MVRIDFLVPGFSKCGTTTLCALLAQHPGLFMPELKEPWYFSSKHYSRHAPGYARHFAAAKPGQLLGEGSQSYSTYQDEGVSIERIFEHNPHCRFIFMARNPLRRIESSYREMHHSGVMFGINAPFGLADCLEMFPQMIRDSMFFERICGYLDTFGPEAVLVLFLEDLRRQPQVEMAKCFRHLGVDTEVVVQQLPRLNEGGSKLYDTAILRYLRARPWLAPTLAGFSREQQDSLFRRLGLRRVFKGPVQWDDRSRAMVRDQVVPDAQKFLERFGKPADFWQF